ncbi:MAG: hypothetical protein DSM106950_34930 [Stigonema ocellatum SAG 48.90 = DSM 106950]|nr:hypothetical protein [Stigonema ocellatum SAG 48.90 = DSM 106950]
MGNGEWGVGTRNFYGWWCKQFIATAFPRSRQALHRSILPEAAALCDCIPRLEPGNEPLTPHSPHSPTPHSPFPTPHSPFPKLLA